MEACAFFGACELLFVSTASFLVSSLFWSASSRSASERGEPDRVTGFSLGVSHAGLVLPLLGEV